MNENDKKLLLDTISGYENEAIDLMKNLIAINAVGPKNDGPGEEKKAAFFERLSKKKWIYAGKKLSRTGSNSFI